MSRQGRDRKEDFNDSMRLFRITMENPIGMQDYVVWFHYGWLLWQHEEKIPEAAEAFYRAGRLSGHKADLYHLESLRHLAHMQYLLGNLEDAYQTIQKALAMDGHHATLYDAARYAARTDRPQESLRLLEACIRMQPTTIVSMFAEEDFVGP